MRKKMGVFIGIGVCIVVATVVGVKYLFDVNQYKKNVAQIESREINMKEIEDGTYTGEYDVNYIAAKVEVVVKDHKIEEIKLIEHKNDRGEAAEKIIDDVVAQNSVQVDTVSGATNSSKVILEAIREALEG